MVTLGFPCGCSITRDMCSYQVVFVTPCGAHRASLQVELKTLADAVQKLVTP